MMSFYPKNDIKFSHVIYSVVTEKDPLIAKKSATPKCIVILPDKVNIYKYIFRLPAVIKVAKIP